MPTIAKLSITPVKSTALTHPHEVRLERWGAVGNRAFFLIDDLNRLFTGARLGPLVRIRSEYDPELERLVLRLPDGEVVDDGADVLGKPTVTDFYGRKVTGREVGGPFEEALSRYAGRWVRLVRPDVSGDAIDVWPVSLVSMASADELARRSGREEPRDARRFRMLMDLDGCEPHEEDTWVGKRVRVGEALIRVPGPIPRCVVTTQSPDTGARDFSTLKEIRRYRGLRDGKNIDFGVYGEVLEPGAIRVGDGARPER